MKKNWIILILVLSLAFGCKKSETEIASKFGYHNYSEAVLDAMVADSSEITHNLIAITKDNPAVTWNQAKDKILVCSFVNGKYLSSYPIDKDVVVSWGEMWMTVVPELRTKMKVLSNSQNPDSLKLRLEQLLGLPANTSNTHIVEFWVSPDNIFRPSPDNEINDNTAGIIFPSSITADYTQWFSNKVFASYYTSNKYPWTRLGYTYDWGNSTTEVGLSEFVVSKNSVIHVVSATKLEDYLKQ